MTEDVWMQAGSVLLALLAVAGGIGLAWFGKPIPDWLGPFIGLVGGAFFSLRGAAIGGGATGYGVNQALGNGHPGTTTISHVNDSAPKP